MSAQLTALVEPLAEWIELLGVLLIAAGLGFAALRVALPSSAGAQGRWRRLRHDLGRAILLGLEVLVAADIVRSVVLDPSMGGVAVLAVVVALRTFLAWSLALELEGRWPWQRPLPATPNPPGA